jgi:hypothetical protein
MTVDISLAVGFSSQSQPTAVFRRFMETTPSAYRPEVLGLNPDGASADRRSFVANVNGCRKAPDQIVCEHLLNHPERTSGPWVW